MRRFAVVAVALALAGPAGADEKALTEAQDTYKQAVEKAEQTLLESFDKAGDLVRKSAKKAEEKQQVVELLKAEKSKFEQHGWYPWSATARPALVEFIRARLTAEKALATAFDKEIDTATKAKEDTRAATLVKIKKDAVAPKLIARWEITGTTWTGTWVGLLYSNGHYTSPDGNAVWAYERGVITLAQPEKDAPGGRKVLKWTLKDNGLEFDEVSNSGGKSTGKLANQPLKK